MTKENGESEIVTTEMAATNRDALVEAGEAVTGEEEEEDARIQPWQAIMDEIERQNSLSPPGSDYFPCQNGFYAHSLAG